MNLISLNTWGCRVPEIFDFFRENAETTDIFCLQELLKSGEGKTHRDEVKNSFEEIGKILSWHTGYFFEYGEDGYYSEPSAGLDFQFGIATFVKKGLAPSLIEGRIINDDSRKWSDYDGRFAAGAALLVKADGFAIVNVHGIWQNSIKNDTEAKIEQSKKIIALAEKTSGPKIIAGDFNLLPDTKSIGLLGEKYQNLIKEYKITDTRGPLYKKDLRFSDYAFADKKIPVKSFKVLETVVSDHLPLSLEFV